MINLIGEVPESAEVLNVSNAHLHLYGKEPRAGASWARHPAGGSVRKVAAADERASGILSPAGVLFGQGVAGIGRQAGGSAA